MGSHGKHDAAYYRNRRTMQRQQLAEAGTPLRGYGDFALSPAFRERGQAMALMMQLPPLDWPTSLYSDSPASIAELMALKDKGTDSLCKCGCGKKHRGNVTMTVNSTHGHGFHVYYFYLEACKTRYVNLNGRK